VKVHHGLSGCFPEPKNGTPSDPSNDPTTSYNQAEPAPLQHQELLPWQQRAVARELHDLGNDGRTSFSKPEEVDGVDELLCFFTVEVMLKFCFQ